jgi:diguanylate cyclase (GGDEF)-like protein
MESASWLCADELARERLLDMERRLERPRARSLGVLAVALLACGFWQGWWWLVPLALAAGGFHLADRRLVRSARPEVWIAAAWVIAQLAIAISAALTGGANSPALPWLVLPVVTLSARFDRRGLVAGGAFTIALMLAVALGVDAAAVAAEPQLLVYPLALLVGVAILSSALMDSDLQHRSQAVLDGLTGMLNRTALGARAQELAYQSQLSGEPVGVIIADLDRFKQVNDVYGHARGDDVLRDVAYVLRKQLRAFDLVYRLGGEEFVVLLPGADEDHAAEVADRLRESISAAPIAGLPITMSFGVAASTRGGPFAYDAVFARADAALYAAKRAGRDRVRRGDGGPALAEAA